MAIIHYLGKNFLYQVANDIGFVFQSLSEIQIQALSGEHGAASKFLVLTVVYLNLGEWMLDIEVMKPANSSIQEGIKLLSVTLSLAI